MFPDPLHPAVVHLPLAFAVLLPVAALASFILLRGRDRSQLHIWAVPALLSLVILGTGWLALSTGEEDEERVEHVVNEAALETHEHAAERFLVLSGVLVLVMGAGLLPGRPGGAARVVGMAGTVVVLVAAIEVGKAGGELVYRYGAASAYAQEAAASDEGSGDRDSEAGAEALARRDHDDGDEH